MGTSVSMVDRRFGALPPYRHDAGVGQLRYGAPMRPHAEVVVVLGVAAALWLAGCNGAPGNPGASSAAASGSGGGAEAADGGASRRAVVRQAELSRRAHLVLETDLSSRDVALRRAAARALARVGGAAARPLLLRALADEDERVVTWAAYGLGQFCEGHRQPTVAALVPASARFGAAAGRGRVDGGAEPEPRLSAWWALARAVGRCAAPESEATLLEWARLADEQAVPAVYALGDLAAHQRRLREETFVALLKLATGDATRPPLSVALYPFGRVPHLPPSVIERTREVALAGLETAGPSRLYAINALSRTGEPAVAVLADVVRRGEDFTATERAQAARGLKQHGSAGQRALGGLLADLTPPAGPVQATTLVGEEFGVLWSVLSSVDSEGKSGGRLRQLANLPVTAELPRPVRRRVSLLRCTAAGLLAERDYSSPLVTKCDVTDPPVAGDGGSEPPLSAMAARVVVQAIGMPGANIRGPRLDAWQRFTKSDQPTVRAAAIRLIADHPEIEQAAQVLAEGLVAKHPGVVAAAAQVIANNPARAAAAEQPRGKNAKAQKPSKQPAAPDPDVVAALLERLGGQGPTADLEALAAVIDAAGALVLDQARPHLRKLCRSPHQTIRTHAQAALTTILGGGEKVRCEPPESGLPLPQELDALVAGPVTLKLETDAGELKLRLDPALAPVAVTRIASLARGGFYAEQSVHRVVPGFVVQFGSPTGDGFGDPQRPALPCETSPVAFGEMSVGMALAGRDTGSTQLFITHGSYPHLDGQYAWLGTASGPWRALAPGDVIRSVTVEP